MNMIDRLAGYVRQGMSFISKGFESLRGSLSLVLSQYSIVQKPYSESIWVYSSIKTIADDLASVPMNLCRLQGKDKVIIEDGPLYRLLTNPNPYMTKTRLMECWATYMSLYGKCFWVVERDNENQVPLFIWPLNPCRFRPTKDAKGMVTGWDYIGLQNAHFETWEVILWFYFNPDDLCDGLTPLSAARLSIDQDWFASNYNRSFFEQGAKMSGFVKVPKELSDPSYNRLMKSLEENHAGYTKAHKILLLENGAEFAESTITQQDMQFIEQKKLSKQEIFAAFGVNSIVMGLYDEAKYEAHKVANQTYWRKTQLPKMTMIEETLWAKFLMPLTDGTIWIEFDKANVEWLQEDFDAKTITAQRLTQMGYPLNQVNKRLNLGFEDVPWGDTWWAPFTLSPVEMILENGTGGVDEEKFIQLLLKHPNKLPPALQQRLLPLLKEPPVIINPTPSPDPAVEPTVKKKAFPNRIKDKSVILEKYLQVQGKIERKFYPKLRRYFFEQRSRVLESLNAHLKKIFPLSSDLKSLCDEFIQFKSNLPIPGKGYGLCPKCNAELLKNKGSKPGMANLLCPKCDYVLYIGWEAKYKELTNKIDKDLTDELFNFNEELKALKEMMEPLYKLAYGTGAESMAEALGVSGFVFNPLDPSFLVFNEERFNKVLPDILSTIKESLRAQVVQGISSGESVTEIAKRVKQVYNMASRRAITIARTESATFINGGRFEEMKKQEVPRHEWLTSGRDSVRGNDPADKYSHVSRNGQIVNVGDDFVDSFGHKLKYPNDPDGDVGDVVNCVCVTSPVVDEEENE